MLPSSTSNLSAGLVVPIPTLPLVLSIVNTSPLALSPKRKSPPNLHKLLTMLPPIGPREAMDLQYKIQRQNANLTPPTKFECHHYP